MDDEKNYEIHLTLDPVTGADAPSASDTLENAMSEAEAVIAAAETPAPSPAPTAAAVAQEEAPSLSLIHI